MTIRRIQVWDYSPAFRDGHYAMSFVTQSRVYGRILQLDTDDGTTGLGEIVFYPTLTVSQREMLVKQETTYLGALIGQSVDSVLTNAKQLRNRGPLWHGITFGLETAALDIIARRQNAALSTLLGGTLATEVDNYFSISEQLVEGIQSRLRIAGNNRRIIQLKVGVGSLDDDVAHISGVLAGMSAAQTVLVDANGGWSKEQALKVIGQFADPRVIWEEPCTSYEDNLNVARTIAAPVMFDTCVDSFRVAKKAVNEPAVASICIKPASLGGLSVAQQIRDLCISNNKQMRIDGPWCGDIASASILHLAVGTPPGLLIAGCDLREPLRIENNLGGVVERPDCRIAPPRGVGLGIDPRRVAQDPPARVIS